MHHNYLYSCSIFACCYLISLSSQCLEGSTARSIKCLVGNGVFFFIFNTDCNFLSIQSSSLHVDVVLVPIRIENCSYILVLCWFEDELAGLIQFKIVALVVGAFNADCVPLLTLLQLDLLSLLSIHLAWNFLILRSFLSCACHTKQNQEAKPPHYFHMIIQRQIYYSRWPSGLNSDKAFITKQTKRVIWQKVQACQLLLIYCYYQMSVNKSLSLTKLEEEILREYKRVSYGEETPKYEVQSIYYSDIPKQLPESLTKNFKNSIVLYNYSFFQMVTFAVLQFLFNCEDHQKTILIEKMRSKIYSQDFMFGSSFIKGLLVKGLRSIIENGGKTTKPIAQLLFKNDAMNAFSQFWKEIIEEESKESCIKHTDISQNLAYRYISNYLGINFQLFWKKENTYEEEKIVSQSAASEEFISIVIFDKNLIQSIITKVLEESQENSDSERGYVLLLKDTRHHYSTAQTQQKCSNAEIQDLREKAAAVTKKGSDLLNKFRQLYRQMREGVI